MSQVTVTIDGKAYRMACEVGQEDHLNDLASKFDRYVGHLREQFGEIGDLRLTVMAGIMVMDELTEVQGKLKGIESELEMAKSTRDKALQSVDKMDSDIGTALSGVATQISSITQKLNEKPS
tara:strand:- start:6706 stop:7071 length:366 start_codon:yes stop_codon:yes gene_type:complete